MSSPVPPDNPMPQQEGVPSAPSPPPTLATAPVSFRVRVVEPTHATPQRVVAATHLNVFRGLYYRGAKGVPQVDKDAPLTFTVSLPWATRPLYPLEAADPEAVARHTRAERSNAQHGTVFLDFLYSTTRDTEYRFGAFFNMHDLVLSETQTLTVSGSNNNMRANNPALTGKGIPAKYTVEVTFLSPTRAAFVDALAKTTGITFPSGLSLRDVFAPTGMEQGSLNVAEWVTNFLGPLLRQDTPFRNIRTFARFPGFAPLFPQLPSLWAQPGSTYPVTLALYLTYNALVMNDVFRDAIINDFPHLTNVTSNLLLRVLRDIALALTMCVVEGHYFGDKLYGNDADDQPYVDGMHNDRTVFARDDCEGRLQQGVKVLQLVAALRGRTPEDVRKMLRDDEAAGLRLLADVDASLLDGIIKSTLSLAAVLAAGVVSFHLDVGEACFRSYPESTPTSAKTLAGHSFGQMHLDPSAPPATQDTVESHPAVQAARRMQATTHVVEGTGWMDEFMSSASKQAGNAYLQRFRHAEQTGELPAVPVMRSATTPEQCDRLYCYVYMQDGHLVFERNAASGKWSYGASPSAIGQPGILLVSLSRLLKTAVALAESPAPPQPAPPTDAAASPQALVQDLVAYTLRQAPQQIRRHLERNASPAQQNLQQVHEQVKELGAYIHPPPDELRIIRQRMQAWAPLNHAPADMDASMHTLVACSTGDDVGTVPPAPGHVVSSHRFMRSMLHLVREPRV